MRYVLLIYGSEALAEEERAAIMRAHPAFLQEVQQRSFLLHRLAEINGQARR